MKFNCVRFLYIENAYKKIGMKNANILANCFLNTNILKTVYNQKLQNKIEEHIPDIFKYELCVPEDYLNIIKYKLCQV